MARSKRKASEFAVPSVADEFAGADLGDSRRAKRLQKIASAFSEAPDRSLPEIAHDGAELEGIYRFLENPHFGLTEMLEPHFRASAERLRELSGPLTYVIHDMSDCSFTLDEDLRDGFVEFTKKSQGFRLEAALALSGEGSFRPLGLLHAEAWAGTKGRTSATRWYEFVRATRPRASTKLVHVIDREGGIYELFHLIQSSGDGFVIRMNKDRVAEFEDVAELQGVAETLVELQKAARLLPPLYEVPVDLSRRVRNRPDPRNPAREARHAKLSVAAAQITLKKPYPKRNQQDLPAEIAVNLVCVLEREPPKGEAPVLWLLATTLPIATTEDVTAVVDAYRARWTIEEFFKALKTGCALAKRQLESFEAMTKILAISLVVAWRSLLLKHESRRAPDAVVTVALTPTQIEVLRATGRLPLSKNPTNQEALFAVAALGGFIKNNKKPGWRVIARGMERLLEREIGWVRGLAAM